MTAISPATALDTSAPPASDLTHLRPTTALEMVDRAFGLLRIRPALFFTLGSIYAMANALAQLLLASANNEQSLARMRPWGFVLYLVAQWPFAAMIAAAFQTLLFPRRPLRITVALRGVGARLPYLILTQTLTIIILFGLGHDLPSYLLESGEAAGPAALIMVSAALASIGLAVFFAISWVLVPVAVMVERRAFFEAMRRSSELMRRRFERGVFGDGAWRRLALLALFPLLLLGSGEVGLFFVERLFFSAATAHSGFIFPYVIGPAVEFVISLLYAPWIAAAFVLLYAECRMRSEALDFQVHLLRTDASALTNLESGISE